MDWEGTGALPGLAENFMTGRKQELGWKEDWRASTKFHGTMRRIWQTQYGLQLCCSLRLDGPDRRYSTHLEMGKPTHLQRHLQERCCGIGGKCRNYLPDRIHPPWEFMAER